jgi:hypothetical protein
MARPNPYKCPDCGGPKSYGARFCLRCRARGLDHSRQHHIVALQGYEAYFAAYDQWGRSR